MKILCAVSISSESGLSFNRSSDDKIEGLKQHQCGDAFTSEAQFVKHFSTSTSHANMRGVPAGSIFTEGEHYIGNAIDTPQQIVAQ